MPMNYNVTDEDAKEIKKRFSTHKANADQLERMEIVRDATHFAGVMILKHCPPSRERALALTKLEEGMMHANSSIVRNENVSRG